MEIVFQQIDDNELKIRFQAAATGDPGLAYDFFNQFDYNIYRANKQHRDAFSSIIQLLAKLKQLDPVAYTSIHKGTPYYFCAISAFHLSNYVNAVYFFDAAVSEDIKNDPGKRTPAVLFMEMDGDNEHQNALQLTQIAGNKLTDFIDQYNSIEGANLTSLIDIRSKLLSRAVGDKPEWRTLATSLISFLLEWEYLVILQDIRIQGGTWEPFYTHLFKGCVLFESLLKANPSEINPGNTLESIISRNEEVRKRLGIHQDLHTSGPTFSDVLARLDAQNGIELDIEIAARLRNTIGHNIGWATPMTSGQYVQLVSKVMNAILHTISGLY